MNNLNDLPRFIREYDAKVLFEKGEIFVIDPDAGVYIDTRTKFDLEENVHDVWACVLDCGYYNYVCPNCGQLHSIHKSKIYNKLHSPGCWNAEGKSREKMIAYIDGEGKIVKLPLLKFRFHIPGSGNKRKLMEAGEGNECTVHQSDTV